MSSFSFPLLSIYSCVRRRRNLIDHRSRSFNSILSPDFDVYSSVTIMRATCRYFSRDAIPRVLDRRDGHVLPRVVSTDLKAGRGLLDRLVALQCCLSSLRETAAVRIPRVPSQQATLKSYINKNNFVFLYTALCILFCLFEYRSLPISDRWFD